MLVFLLECFNRIFICFKDMFYIFVNFLPFKISQLLSALSLYLFFITKRFDQFQNVLERLIYNLIVLAKMIKEKKLCL